MELCSPDDSDHTPYYVKSHSKDKPRKKKTIIRRPYLKKANRVRQNYKPEDVLAAMHAIWRGMSRRQAAKVFNIPRSTLLDKLDGKRPVDASPGPNPFLTKAEERTLEAWAVDMYQRGFPLKTEDLKDMAQAVIQSNQRRTSFKNDRPGRSWMRNFLLRHPRVYEIGTDAARKGRSVTTRDEVRNWCQQHRNFMASLGHEEILDDPEGTRVFNVDHSEFLFDAETGNFLEQERHDERERVERAGVECVSVVATFSAAGTMAPLMFVFPLKELPHEVVESFPSGWVGTHSDSGFLTGKIFMDYIVAFRRWLEQENVTMPVLLLLDGRRSRLNMDVTRFCEEQGIILYCLFPTPRPAIAELFSAIFHDLPDGRVLGNGAGSHGITKYNLAVRLREALSALDDSDKSKSVFHTYGILPHLQTMLQTLGEVSAVPLGESFRLTVPPTEAELDTELGSHVEELSIKDELSDGECDFDLMPIEGEIEMEFPDSGHWDPHTFAALHPALQSEELLAAEAPSYLVMNAPGGQVSLPVGNRYSHHNPTPFGYQNLNSKIPANMELQGYLPDLSNHLVVERLPVSTIDTAQGIESVESEISEVLHSIMSMEASGHALQNGFAESEEAEDLSPPPSPSKEPFLGFSSDVQSKTKQEKFSARICLDFMEKFLAANNLLNEFHAASAQRQWSGDVTATKLFEMWLVAHDGVHNY